MRYYVAFIALLLAGCMGTWAYNVSGTVIDTQGEPLMRASVRLLQPKDSTVVKGAIADDNGAFTIADVKKGKYILEASYVGYTPKCQNIEVKGNVQAGNLILTENATLLEDITVTGIKTPIRVAEDTVEFNADSYRTQPNAVVEDLLKRLPGVEVDTDGKITHNGKQVSKILVDGKEFFSDDPTVASRNLPVNMVEKLQVVDRKSDLARMTGVDDGEEETVINLTVKKGMKNGWFGTVEAGYGTDSRYKASFNINRFWNDNQITFIGGANNVNDMGFTDGGSGRFRRFGGNNGITTSEAFGVNFNVGNEEIFRVGGDVMYSHTSRDTRTSQDRQTLFPDSISFYDSKNTNKDRGHNLRADFRIQWKPDSFNTFEFRPNVSLNYNDSKSSTMSNTHAGRPGTTQMGAQVNSNSNQMQSHGNSFEFGGRLIYNHNFKSHPGRSFSIYAQLRTSNIRERSNTYSRIKYYLLNQDSIFDQFEDNHTWSNTFRSRVSWTEPIGNSKNGHFMEFAYQIQYRWNNADKLTYDRPVTYEEYMLSVLDPLPGDELNEDLSNRFRNNYMNQDIRVGYKYVSATQNLNVGLSVVPQMSRSIDLINSNKSIPERNTLNVAPYLRYRYKMSKTRSMNMFYNGRSSQPSMSQLQPVADTSDPLNIVQGNPNLKPSFSHNINVRFQDFNMEAQRSIMAMLMGSMTQNSIVTKSIYDSTTGGKFTTYENVNGIWNLNGFTMISFPFRNKTWTFNNHFGGNYSHMVGYNNGLKNTSGNLGIFLSPGIAFRPENLELELRPTYRLQTSHNSVQTSANRTVHSYGGRFSGTYYTPFGLVLSTDLNYTANQGYGQGFNKNEWMWNATVSYMTLRDRSLTISLSAYDILQQRNNVQRSVTANYIQDALYNSLTRYVMVSVSYKFNTFGKGNEPADRNRPNFGPGGPMGPPPGGRPPRM